MPMGRDWRKTLFRASFKGVPFHTDRDTMAGGRRIVPHEMPMRDDPFLEDLGEKKRDFSLTAYVASDAADADAAALVAVCAARGTGLLVLPLDGPVLVKLVDFERSFDKDRMGYIALTLKFIRQGASTSLITVASLANVVYVRADAIVPAVAAFVSSALWAFGQPDFVLAGATNAIADGAATLEAVRTSEPVDTTVSAEQRVMIQALFDGAPAMVTSGGVAGDQVAGLVTVARSLADGMSGNDALTAFEQVIQQASVSPAERYMSDAAQRADQNRVAVYVVIRLAAATAYAEAIARADIPDRQTGITLRANAAEYFDDILAGISAYDAPLYVAVSNLANSATDYLSRAILDRAPVIPVAANRSMPSLWWAHRLYQDPNRGAELVARNRVVHPSFMPPEFEALSR